MYQRQKSEYATCGTDSPYRFGLAIRTTHQRSGNYYEIYKYEAAVSGYVHQPENALNELAEVSREQEILFTYGTFDPIIPVEKVKGQLHQLSADGKLQIQSHEFAKEHTIAGVEELSLIRDFIRVRGPED